MKLFSINQILLVLLICAILFFGIGLLVGLYSIPESEIQTSDNPETNDTVDTNLDFQLQPVKSDDTDTKIDPDSISQDEYENIQVYKRMNQGVVNITSVAYGYNWFLEVVPEEGTGSGSIIDKRGYILTNYHVIKGAEDLFVTLADGSEFNGNIVGIDPENDLAVIKIDPQDKDLVTIPFGTSANLMVGNKVLAIGNPFGLERTLTTGIVSGLGRPIEVDKTHIIRDMIQTDASINPGNSGGPLLNARGEMIGVNTMIYSPSGGSVGVGFAVPIDIAKRVVPDLIKYGRVQRGWIDIVAVQLFPALAEYAKLPVKKGILVSEVVENSLAQKAGLVGGKKTRAVRYGRQIIYLGGDIIVEIDNVEIFSLADFYSALEDNKPGEIVQVKVIRDNNLTTLSVVLSERKGTY